MTNLITTLYFIAWSDYVSTSSTHDSDNTIMAIAKITAMKIYSDGLIIMSSSNTQTEKCSIGEFLDESHLKWITYQFYTTQF